MSDERKLARIEAWQSVRAKGVWHYTLYRGLLMWGVAMFIGMGVAYPFVRGETPTPTSLAIAAVIWSVGGLLWGYITFRTTDAMIRQMERKNRS